jgi:hypothetical protein
LDIKLHKPSHVQDAVLVSVLEKTLTATKTGSYPASLGIAFCLLSALVASGQKAVNFFYPDFLVVLRRLPFSSANYSDKDLPVI